MTIFYAAIFVFSCRISTPESDEGSSASALVSLSNQVDSGETLPLENQATVDESDQGSPSVQSPTTESKNTDFLVPKPAQMDLGLAPYSVPVPSWMTPPPVPSDNPLTHAGVALGRLLFYEPMLSGNNTQSCSSCHQQKLSFTDGKRVSIGSEGRALKRNAMALVNLAWTAPYFWDGSEETLESLVPVPITDPDELNQNIDQLIQELSVHPKYPGWFETAFPNEGITERTISKAIAQFLRTLVSFNSRADLLNAGKIDLTELEQRGNQLMIDGFPKGDVDAVADLCDKCHLHSAGVKDGGQDMGLFTDSSFKTNGLAVFESDLGRQKITGQSSDRGLFIVPTIRNLTVTAPYMHDGRLKSLEDVVTHYSELIQANPQLESPLIIRDKPIRMNLNEEDKKAVLAILGIFTDEDFLVNPAFSNPHD